MPHSLSFIINIINDVGTNAIPIPSWNVNKNPNLSALRVFCFNVNGSGWLAVFIFILSFDAIAFDKNDCYNGVACQLEKLWYTTTWYPYGSFVVKNCIEAVSDSRVW